MLKIVTNELEHKILQLLLNQKLNALGTVIYIIFQVYI